MNHYLLNKKLLLQHIIGVKASDGGVTCSPTKDEKHSSSRKPVSDGGWGEIWEWTNVIVAKCKMRRVVKESWSRFILTFPDGGRKARRREIHGQISPVRNGIGGSEEDIMKQKADPMGRCRCRPYPGRRRRKGDVDGKRSMITFQSRFEKNSRSEHQISLERANKRRVREGLSTEYPICRVTANNFLMTKGWKECAKNVTLKGFLTIATLLRY